MAILRDWFRGDDEPALEPTDWDLDALDAELAAIAEAEAAAEDWRLSHPEDGAHDDGC